MSNKYRIKHSDKIIESQLADKTDKISNDFADNSIGYYSSIIRNILSNMKDYLLNLGSPSFKNRKAKYIPSSEDYNQNNLEIINDLKNASGQSNSMLEILKDNYNYSVLFNNYIAGRVDDLNERLRKLKLNAESKTNNFSNKLAIVQDFTSLNQIDTQKTTADIDLNSGLASLSIKEYEEKMPSQKDGTRIKILDSSNGFNGRLQQAITKGNTDNVYLPSAIEPFPKDQRGFSSNVMYLSMSDDNWHADP
ncbi:MAG: hypothetical protein ACOCRO_06285, partial [Halanaerobiales bacterium]